jgi:hypothetical protein
MAPRKDNLHSVFGHWRLELVSDFDILALDFLAVRA